jgi:hypothetical protein
MLTTAFKAAVGLFALAICMPSMAQVGPFPREQSMSPAPAVNVLATKKVGDKERPERIIDHAGKLAVISYDAEGRPLTITYPHEHKIAVLSRDANGKVSGATLIDSATGSEVFTAHKNPGLKILTDGVDYAEVIIVVGSYDNPWAGDFWGGSGPPGFSWVQVSSDPPPNCSKTACNQACDVGLATAGLGCTAIGVANAPAGLLCGAAALGARVSCGQACDGDGGCTNP